MFNNWRHNLTRKRRRLAGFTLVEVMVASAVLLIVSSGIIAGIISALKAQANAADHYRATCIARNRIQHARSVDFYSLNLSSETNVMVDGLGNLCTSATTGDYRRTTMITSVNSNCMLVTVQVWYPEAPGRLSTQPVEIVTMLTDKM